jgi:alginate O-acetyltransferase complex protein AlgI
MIFNSFVFWAYFALVIALYWRLPHRGQNLLLLVASYVFYGYWDWKFLGLLFASTAVDYYVSTRIAQSKSAQRRYRLIVLSVVANLTFLGFFKYFGFFVREMGTLLTSLGFEPHLPVLSIVLPVGISFYTFQSMSYTIDVYRGTTRPARNFFDFALFVSYFPQLVAGPIERSSDLLPQLEGKREYRKGDFQEGLYHVLLGLFKKVVLADNLALVANHAFDTSHSGMPALDVTVGVLAFAMQIYGDFSGYSSIAQGVSRWMGIGLSYNFRMPYFARSPSEFWQRWHISLSSWLRDYLYIPLGGNRRGNVRTYVNLMLTMLLGGLWHGAAWTFIFWGAWQGILLAGYRLVGMETTRSAAVTRPVRSFLQALLMLAFVCIGWIFFRAVNLSQALDMIYSLAGSFQPTAFSAYGAAMLLFFAGPLLVYEWLVYRADDMLLLLRQPLWVQYLGYAYLMMMLVMFPPLTQQIFIYFQF